jgi:hypothetical protein
VIGSDLSRPRAERREGDGVVVHGASEQAKVWSRACHVRRTPRGEGGRERRWQSVGRRVSGNFDAASEDEPGR